MRADRVAIIGAGIGGLAAAVELAAHGVDVIVVEKADAPGGKMREVLIGEHRIDAGPTVFTMPWVFEEVFSAAGSSLADHVTLTPVETLARHAWTEADRLDLFADVARSADAIGRFAGAAEARRYRAFCERCGQVYRTLEQPFIRAARPTPLSLTRDGGVRGLLDLWRIAPFATLWRELGRYFHDPRLRQLFGRYATYCGSSPFAAPATLMLVAHVEQTGVWLVEGGMHRLARALAGLAVTCGATFRYGAEADEILTSGGRTAGLKLTTGERIAADAVVVNADIAALSSGRLGREAAPAAPNIPSTSRSLSALTWTLVAATDGFPLLRHNVFFSNDYVGEFDDIFHRASLPAAPTIYVCAQDRGDRDDPPPAESERLLCLVNAPPVGDARAFDRPEIERCEQDTFRHLERCGLTVNRTPANTVTTTPEDFERLFPGTGGALYGQATHGWRASFRRPGARTRLPGLYLAGGSTHPGPGVPMAALSGRLAASSLLADLVSNRPSSRAATYGGTSTV